jgi:3-hydroxyacyl-[acyl-carrier-protein] dehydratase
VKFNLIDKIESISDQKIVAVKHVSLAEDYLADHFPRFPVLPGVFMLEAMVQSAGWLLHHRRGFSCTFATLREARNVKYGHFAAPGSRLVIEVEFGKDTDTGASFKCTGMVEGKTALSAKLDLSYFNLKDRCPELGNFDERLQRHTRQRWEILHPASVENANP